MLSGFLITGKLLEARAEVAPFRSFYIRRFLRIFPLYYLVLATVLIALPALVEGIRADSLVDQLPLWLYYSNFQIPEVDVERVVDLGHFWSLAVEEQFYLLWPLVVLRGSIPRSIRLCAAALLVAPALRLVAVVGGADWLPTYAWTPMRADGLLVGSLLALVRTRDGFTVSFLRVCAGTAAASGAVLAWAAWTHSTALVFRTDATLDVATARVLMPTLLALFYGAVLPLALSWPRPGRLLSSAPLAPIARYSYGIYVYHYLLVPTLDRFVPAARLAATLGSANRGALAYFVVGSAISYLLAALSYHLFEARFLALKPAHRPKSLEP